MCKGWRVKVSLVDSRQIVLSSLVGVSLLLSACGGGGSGGDTATPVQEIVDGEVKTGYFKDSAVSGLEYVSCNESNTSCLDDGVTGIDGDFKYRDGDTVRFKLGDLVIAEGPAKPLLIPSDVSRDETSSKKLGQFLMTLDSDSDPLNGISIPYAVKQNAKNLTFEPNADFYSLTKDTIKLQKLVNDVNGEDKTLVSQADVEEHLQMSTKLQLFSQNNTAIKHFLGEKYYNPSSGSHYNAIALNANPKKRLLLGIWQEKQKELNSKIKEYSDATTQEEKDKARLDYAITVTKSIVDSVVMFHPSNVGDSTVLEFGGTLVSLYSEGAKVGLDIDMGAHSDVVKGMLAGSVGAMDSSEGAATKGFIRGGTKDLVSASLGYSGASDSLKVAWNDAAWPLVDTILSQFDGTKFNPTDPQVYADQLEKIARAAVNVRAAMNISANTGMADTVQAVYDYLNAYYQSGQDKEFMISRDDIPMYIDPEHAYEDLELKAEASSTWQDWVKFGQKPINREIFLSYVQRIKLEINLAQKTYLKELSPSATDVAAILSPIPDKVCNGASFELRASTDKGFEQNPDDLTNILWQTPSNVLSNVSGLTNRVTFNKSGYYTIGVNMDIDIEGQKIGVGDFAEVLVLPCVDMSLDNGMQRLSVVETTDEYIKYEAIAKNGYDFYSWSQKNSGKNISSSNVHTYKYEEYSANATIRAKSKVHVTLGPVSHKGIQYNTVVSPYTGKVWLDRDINATKACEDVNESTCIGEAHAWSTQLDELGEDVFLNAQITQKNLQNIVGETVCPTGFRIPTSDEFQIETVAQELSGKQAVLDSFLKIGFDETNWINKYWTSSYVDTTDYAYPQTIITDGSDVRVGSSERGHALRMRCIHDSPGSNNIVLLDKDVSVDVIKNIPKDFNLSVIDIDGDVLVYELVVSPQHGAITGTMPNITYTPVLGFTGLDTLEYRVNDGHGYSNIQKIEIFVYGTVTSQTTDRVWLDRNLGALKVCETIGEWDCFGYYYQWGRGNDGHQDYKRKTIGSFTSVLSVATNGWASTLDSAGNYYYTTVGGFGDWVNEDGFGIKRMKRWKSTDGSSICPTGFKVPNSEEFRSELTDSSTKHSLFESILKFPSNGNRLSHVNSVINTGVSGALWTSDAAVRELEDQRTYFIAQSDAFVFNEEGAGITLDSNDNGFGVRCIKAE